MKRKFEEKREVTESISRTVCDICGEVVMRNKSYIRVSPASDHQMTDYDDELEICSTECLEKNIKGIRCILDTRVVHTVSDTDNRKAYTAPESSSGSKDTDIIIPIYIGK